MSRVAYFWPAGTRRGAGHPRLFVVIAGASHSHCGRSLGCVRTDEVHIEAPLPLPGRVPSSREPASAIPSNTRDVVIAEGVGPLLSDAAVGECEGRTPL